MNIRQDVKGNSGDKIENEFYFLAFYEDGTAVDATRSIEDGVDAREEIRAFATEFNKGYKYAGDGSLSARRK